MCLSVGTTLFNGSVPPIDAPIKAEALNRTDRPHGEGGDWIIEPLRGWHLPHLSDPAFQPFLPLLQRSLLLALPEKVLSSLEAPGLRRHRVLVALAPGHTKTVLGLIISRALNRRRTCWQICHLRLASESLASVSRLDVTAALVRQAIGANQTAASWVARASSLDLTRLTALREAGFQPQLREDLWCWHPPANAAPQEALPSGLQLLPLQPRLLPLLWHLEQATTPAPLRQLLDRRLDDLRGAGACWLVIDPSRDQAVASLRHLGLHPHGGHELDLRLHPARGDLQNRLLGLLLARYTRSDVCWLRADRSDLGRRSWLEGMGAQLQGDEVLMARSVWRRQARRDRAHPVGRLEAVMQQLQPRRAPLPTPSTAPW